MNAEPLPVQIGAEKAGVAELLGHKVDDDRCRRAIASLETERFTEVLLANPQVSLALLQHLTAIIRRNNRRIVDLSTRTDVQRVYSELLRLSEPDPRGDGSWLITRMPKHKEIAAWAGTTEESVATALGQLIKVGLAKRRYPSLHIMDRAKVRLLAELG